MTHIGVTAGTGRALLSLRGDALRPRVLSTTPDTARVALVATTALLLGGDSVSISVQVGRGTTLQIVETAGAVAYDARGARSDWAVEVVVEAGGVLLWNGLPFVVADGAQVVRRTEVTLDEGAVACLRETLVLGRDGEVGGSVRAHTAVSLGGRPLLVEDLDLRVARSGQPDRDLPGVLAGARVVDTVSIYGRRGEASTVPRSPAAQVFQLAGPGTVDRFVGAALHESPLAATYHRWTCDRAAAEVAGPPAVPQVSEWLAGTGV